MSQIQTRSPEKQNSKTSSQLLRALSKRREPSLNSKNSRFELNALKSQGNNLVKAYTLGPNITNAYYERQTQNGSQREMPEMKASKYPSTVDHSQFSEKDPTQFHELLKSTQGAQPLSANSLKTELQILLSNYRRKLQEQTHQLTQQIENQSQQIVKLQKTVQQNNAALKGKESKIEQLQSQLKKESKKNNDKLRVFHNGIETFKNYYQQCYDYTLKRVFDVEKVLQVLGDELTLLSERKLCQMVSEVKQRCMTLVGNCLAKTTQIQIESMSQIEDMIEQTEAVKEKLNYLSSKETTMENFQIKKKALFEHLQFFKETLSSWKNQQFILSQTEFEENLLAKSIQIEKSQLEEYQSQAHKRSKIQKKNNNLNSPHFAKIQRKAECLSQKIISLQSQISIMTHHQQKLIQQAEEQKSYSQLKICQLENQIYNNKSSEKEAFISQSNLASNKTIDSRRCKQLSRKLADMELQYEQKLKDKDVVIYHLQTDVSTLKQITKQLDLQLQAKEIQCNQKIQQLKYMLAEIEENVNGHGQNIEECKRTANKCSFVSFGGGSPRERDFVCTYPRLNQQSREDKPLNFVIAEEFEQLRTQNLRLKQQSQTLKHQIEELNQQNSQLLIQQNHFSTDYQNYIQKFQSQSVAFQKMLKVLRKENKTLYQEKDQLHKELNELKKKQKSKSKASIDSRNTSKNDIEYQKIQSLVLKTNYPSSKKIEKQDTTLKLKSPSAHKIENQSQSKTRPKRQINREADFVQALSRQQSEQRIFSKMSQNSKVSRVSKEIKQSQNSSSYQSSGCSTEGSPLNGYLETSRVYENNFIVDSCANLRGNLIIISEAVEFCGFKIPTPCMIDQTGYLKHAYQGTYIMNSKGTLYRLSKQNIRKAEQAGTIRIIS